MSWQKRPLPNPLPRAGDGAHYHFCERRFDPFNAALECKPLPPLTEAEREVVHKNGTLVHKYLPELVPFVKALHAEGMIEGWRCVANVVLFNADPSTSSGRTDNKRGNDHGAA